MKNICIQCGKEFELSDGEINFYRNKKLELPKRCKKCRQKNKSNCSVQSTGVYHYDGISDRHNKITTRRTNNSRRKSCIIIGIIALLILLFAGGNYAGQFFHETRDNTNPVQSQTDIDDQRTESKSQTDSDYNRTESKSQADSDYNRTESISQSDSDGQKTEYQYRFRNDEYLTEHFEKHGSEFGYITKEEYLEGANKVIASSDSMHKQEAEDSDDVYFLESTGGLVIVSTDGYIRTYFKPEDGIDYFNRQ